MPFNITIYAAAKQPLTRTVLTGVLGAEDVPVQQVAPSQYRIAWENVSITLNVMDSQAIPGHLRGLTGYLTSMDAPPAVMERLKTINLVMALIIEPGVDADGHIRDFVLGLTERFDGMFFAANAFYDPDNNLLVGLPDARDQFFLHEIDSTPASIARKERSEAILDAESVVYAKSLGTIEDEAEVTLRTRDEIACRAMCLCLIACYATGMPGDQVRGLIQKYGLEAQLSPAERAFLANPQPDDHEQVNFSWRFEAYHLLLWALGYVDALTRPDAPADATPDMSAMQTRTAEKFNTDAVVRPVAEILDAADLIYRYHNAVVSARLNGQPAPAGLHPGVVYERHYALNWLIGYGDADWDDVSTDT